MRLHVAPLYLAGAVRADCEELARIRGLDAFWRGEQRPLPRCEAMGWDEGAAFVPLAQWLPRPLLGPRSAAWRERVQPVG